VTDVVALTERLCRVPTPNPGGDEHALAVLLAAELRARGADEVAVEEVPRPGSRGAWVFARFGRPRVLLNSHLDTVPAGPGWSADAFAPWHAPGRLYGLGTADTKGAIAAMLAALDEARPDGAALLFTGDEEQGSSCLRAFLTTPRFRALREGGLRQAVIGEPTSGRVATRHRGIVGLAATLAGPGGHSSRADETVAPVAELARLAVAFADWGRARRAAGPPGFPGQCLNIGRLDGGVAFNVIPAAARLEVSVRPPPGTDWAGVRDELLALAAAVVPAAVLTTMVAQPPLATRAPAAFVPLLGAAAAAPIDLAYWTEAAWLADAGVDAVVCGPGDIAQAHAADEWVLESDLRAAQALYAGVYRACGRLAER
jgi:acetylornithine deacetylase